MKTHLENFPKNLGGPLYYFGNRNLTLPDINGNMKVDASWLQESFTIIYENTNGKPFRRCYEPFSGSACWSFTAMELGFSDEYIINDCNVPLIDFFILAKENPTIIKEYYRSISSRFEQSKNKLEFFLDTIETYNSSEPLEKALIFSFIINYSWGGMVFHDKNGNIIYKTHEINGKIIPGYICKPSINFDEFCEELDRISSLLNNNNVTFLSTDFEQTLLEVTNEDFVILNPPYPENERSNDQSYGLYFEISPSKVLHNQISRIINKFEEKGITYFMSYGLYNPDMKDFIVDEYASAKDYYLRVIGYQGSIFGEALDQVYFNRALILPKNLNSKLILASEIIQDQHLTHENALNLFKRMSDQKILS